MSLRPCDIIKIPEFDDFQEERRVVLSNCKSIRVQDGKVDHKGCVGESKLFKLPQVVTKEEVISIRRAVKKARFDDDPDSVDGMPTYEMYIESPKLNESQNSTAMKLDHLEERKVLRKKLQKIMKPIIEERITPFVQSVYSPSKSVPTRVLTPCYNFIRRYKQNERRSHETHRDGHAYVTVVVSLADYGREYEGGLYVATADRYKSMVPLNRGDAVVHQHDLLHGVKVYNNKKGERWSWILWYKDSKNCKDHSVDWFKPKAYAGIPVFQALYANVAPPNEMIEWHQKAADQGFSNSMVKLARAYLKLLPSKLEFNPKKAAQLYKKAIETTQDPHAQYGVAQMILGGLIKFQNPMDAFKEVVNLLEESSKGGNVYAMFNLGIFHSYGYFGKDENLAKEWFEASGLPEGFCAASELTSNPEKKRKLKQRATNMGYDTRWRKMARQTTGLGGAGGVDLNLPWPQLGNSMKVQKW